MTHSVSDNRRSQNVRRFLVNVDEEGWWGWGCQDKTDPSDLRTYLEEEFIDKLADNDVDLLSVCLWSWFKCEGRSRVVERRRGRPDWDCRDRLYEVGEDPVDIMVNRCRQRGVVFMAGMRMNDPHSDEGCPKGRFVMDNPQWHLTRPPMATTMDYSYEPVRRQILAYIEDMLATYDVDGIEFDYLRAPRLFQAGTGPANAAKLTAFTKATRELLDAAAARRGRNRLALGVRVPQHLAECEYLGLDVAAWIDQGSVDYVCPSDWWYTDANTKIEDFVKLAKGASCAIYPMLSPSPGPSLAHFMNGQFKNVPYTQAQHRAAAHAFLSFGADGLQMYNLYPPGINTEPADALAAVRRLLDTAGRTASDRHYIVCLHRGVHNDHQGDPVIDKGLTDFAHVPVIRLRRIREIPLPNGAFDFRLTEDLTDPTVTATLQFKAIGMTEQDALQVELNCFRVPERFVSRSSQIVRDEENDKTLRFCQYSVALDKNAVALHVVNGDNQLRVRLLPDWSSPEGEIVVGEVEVYVSVGK